MTIIGNPLIIGSSGGGSSYTLLTTKEYTVNTTSTSATTLATISLGSSYFTSNKILYVKTRDKAGPRNGYFVASDVYFFNTNAANSSTSTMSTVPRVIIRKNASGTLYSYFSTTTGYGVYGWSISSSGDLIIQQRYSSNYSLTINGTYEVRVYMLDYAPTQGNPYNYSFS